MKAFTLKITRQRLPGTESCPCAGAAHAAGYAKRNCFGREDSFREKCVLLFLDEANGIVGHYELAVGGMNSVDLDIRLACIALLGSGCRKGILVHNHPSGSCLPSPADIEKTAELKKAFNTVGCKLTDHLILSDDGFFSFAEDKTLKRTA